MSEPAAQRPPGPRRVNNLRLGDVQIVLAESRAHVRSGLKGALAESGLYNVEDAGRTKLLSETLTQAIGPDILICDAGLDGDTGVCDIVRALRNNELGRNPFVCIIAVTWNPTAEEVGKIIASGVDTLLAAPFSPQQILDRVDSLVHNRMPFVVTSDYVGPDRRSGSDRGTTLAKLEAPNTLRAKAFGQWDVVAMRNVISGAIGHVKKQKIERQAIDIAYLAEQVMAQSSMPGPDMSHAHLERLDQLLVELDARAREQKVLELCELSASAGKLVATMRKSHGARQEKDLQLLHHLSLAIRAAAQPRVDGESSLALDIANTVNSAR